MQHRNILSAEKNRSITAAQSDLEAQLAALLSGGGNTHEDSAPADARGSDDGGGKPPEAPAEPEVPVISVMEKVENLIGAAPFKELCHQLDKLLPMVRRCGTEKAFFSESYLFTGGRGCGYTTALNILGDLLIEHGIFTRPGARMRVHEMTAPAAYGDDKVEDKFTDFLHHLEVTVRNASNSILSIDISALSGQTGSSRFKKALDLLSQSEQNLIVFHAAPMGEEQLANTLRDIADILNVTPVDMPAFTDDELRQLLSDCLADYGCVLSDEAAPLADRLIEQEKADGYFYGIKTVAKLAAKIVNRIQLQAVSTGSPVRDSIVADSKALYPLLADVPTEENIGLDELADMVGMEPIIEQLRAIIAQIAASRADTGVGSPLMHMAFLGAPGTGKTTVARAIGSILRKSGILRVGRFCEHHARDFVGKYVGHTAPLTTRLCEEAYGSVLFIDEAYSLVSENRAENGRDYGHEALDVLVAQMENHRDDLIVIFAGYSDEMQRMLADNAGMNSRVKYFINFPNYTRDQLCEIYLRQCREHFTVTPALEQRAVDHFRALSDELVRARDFGNARYCRSLYEITWGKALTRTGTTDLKGLILDAPDLDAAVSSLPEHAAGAHMNPIGFGV